MGFVNPSIRGMNSAGFPGASSRACNLRRVESMAISPIDGARVTSMVGVKPNRTCAFWKLELVLGARPSTRQS